MKYVPQISLALASIALLIIASEYSLDETLVKSASKIPDQTGIQSRLQKLGRNHKDDYLNFRIAQLAYISLSAAILSTIYFLGFISLLLTIFLAILAILLIHFTTERNLNERIKRKASLIDSELPAILELLTLSIGAGESPVAAIARISERAHGVIASEFSKVIKEIESGKAFAKSLDDMSLRLDSFSIHRFVDALIISIDRGTPLVETLSSQAIESRAFERSLIINQAAKAEVTMMIPVVFLILPISILFALFPSLSSLSLFGSG